MTHAQALVVMDARPTAIINAIAHVKIRVLTHAEAGAAQIATAVKMGNKGEKPIIRLASHLVILQWKRTELSHLSLLRHASFNAHIVILLARIKSTR